MRCLGQRREGCDWRLHHGYRHSEEDSDIIDWAIDNGFEQILQRDTLSGFDTKSLRPRDENRIIDFTLRWGSIRVVLSKLLVNLSERVSSFCCKKLADASK